MMSELQEFGGPWTQEKLRVLRDYLIAYQTALQKQCFTLEYIDAFAGTGWRTERGKTKQERESVLFGDEADLDDFFKGSARIALDLESKFDKYTFIEKDRRKIEELRKLGKEPEYRSLKIEVIHGDANDELKRMCSENWLREGRRGVLFIDPFATQLRWSTLQEVAATRTLDVWILFPLSAVNRLMVRTGKIRDTWRSKLDVLFGEPGWESALYHDAPVQPDLFGEESEMDRKMSGAYSRIRAYFVNRLKSEFPGVAEHPRFLLNRKGAPIFLLCFAASSPAGSKIAVRIANHLLKAL